MTYLSALLPHRPSGWHLGQCLLGGGGVQAASTAGLGRSRGARTSPGRWLRTPPAETCHLPGPVDTHSSPFLPLPPGSKLQTPLPRNQPSLPPRCCPERALPSCPRGLCPSGWGLWSLPGLSRQSFSLWLTCPHSGVGSVPNGGRGNAVALG